MPINHFWLNLALLSLCTRCLSPLWLLCSVPVCSARPNEKEWAEPLLKHFSNIFVHFPEFNSHTAHCYACAYNTLVVWSVCLCVFSLDFFFGRYFHIFVFIFLRFGIFWRPYQRPILIFILFHCCWLRKHTNKEEIERAIRYMSSYPF